MQTVTNVTKRRARQGRQGRRARRPRVDDHLVALADLARKQLQGQRVLDLALDQALQRPRAVRRVVPLLRQILARGVGQAERELALGEPRLQRPSWMSTIPAICSRPSGSNTTISSTRFTNSGRNVRADLRQDLLRRCSAVRPRVR